MPPRCRMLTVSGSVTLTGVPPASLTSSTAAPVARMRLPLSSSTVLYGLTHMKTDAEPG